MLALILYILFLIFDIGISTRHFTPSEYMYKFRNKSPTEEGTPEHTTEDHSECTIWNLY